MTIDDIDRRIQQALARFALGAELVSNLSAAEDGTGTASGVGDNDENVYDVELCAGAFGFRSRPMDGASGIMLKLGGEGGSAFVIGFRDRQYEISVDKGESAAFSASGAFTKWDKNGNIINTPAGAGTVQLAGTTTPLAMWKSFRTDLKTILEIVKAGVVLSTGQYTAAQVASIETFLVALAAGTYDSTLVTNG